MTLSPTGDYVSWHGPMVTALWHNNRQNVSADCPQLLARTAPSLVAIRLLTSLQVEQLELFSEGKASGMGGVGFRTPPCDLQAFAHVFKSKLFFLLVTFVWPSLKI